MASSAVRLSDAAFAQYDRRNTRKRAYIRPEKDPETGLNMRILQRAKPFIVSMLQAVCKANVASDNISYVNQFRRKCAKMPAKQGYFEAQIALSRESVRFR